MIPAAWICLFLPLAGAAVITLAGNRISRRAAGYLATASVAGSFACAAVVFALLLGDDPEERQHFSTLWEWLAIGGLKFGLRIVVDPLSVFMMLVVAGVGSLIVAYSIGYMDGDDEERRFFAYMALFVFSMLLLVQGGNLLLLLAGWGLVGLSSYLLIGFWHQRRSAVAAAKKAFVMNAFGDATMALALFLLIQHVGSLDYERVFAAAPGLSTNSWLVNLVALGLLGGAVAKSAQIPLHTWLPDAMEGPTPVSALIHAATMVTAGVYLIVRAHPLFEVAPTVQELAAGLGAATLLVAGLVALVQTDIKRVIAYSTMSQIGYMFLAAGLGAYASAMFHLMTHAFFKALLFMAAGIVIHALAGEQDIRKMGGLRSALPKTWIAFGIGSLALVGIPPFAGFFSKDSILAGALDHGTYGAILWGVGLAGAFLTGLYTFRLLFLVFGTSPHAGAAAQVRAGAAGHGDHSHELAPSEPGDEPPGTHEHPAHAGEGPFSMTSTVAALAVLAAVGGFIQFADVWTPITDFLHPVADDLVHASRTQEVLTSILAVSFGGLGILVAWGVYVARHMEAPRAPRLRAFLEEKLYFDRLYDVAFYYPAVALARGWHALIERPLIGGSITGIASGTRRLGSRVTAAQTGLVRTYALALAGSLAVLAVVFVSIR